MISHLFTNYQTTHSTHIPNPFIIDDKLLYTMIQNYGQHLSPYPLDGYYVHVGNQQYKVLLSEASFRDYGIYILKASEQPSKNEFGMIICFCYVLLNEHCFTLFHRYSK